MSTRIFLVGAGIIAQYHAAAVRRLPAGDTIPIYFTDPNPAAVSRFLGLHPSARPFPSVEDLLAVPSDPEDIVIVATPPTYHCSISVQAFRSGRHVLCEKPMAMNEVETREMLAAARAADRLLGCCSCRFLGIATTTAARDIVRDGRLGSIYHATIIHRERRMRPGIEYQPSSPWFLEKSKNGGGTLMNMGPYDFTTLNYVLEPKRVEILSAWQTNPTTALNLPPGIIYDTEQHAGASLRYHLTNGNVMAVTYERSSCTHGAERAIFEIEGQRGAIQWNWLDGAKRGILRFSNDHEGSIQDENRELSTEMDIPLHERPLVYFHQRIHGMETTIAINEQAVFNFSILLAIYRCAETGQSQTITR